MLYDGTVRDRAMGNDVAMTLLCTMDCRFSKVMVIIIVILYKVFNTIMIIIGVIVTH